MMKNDDVSGLDGKANRAGLGRNRPSVTQWTVHDLIERLQEEVARRHQAERRYRNLFDNSPAMLVNIQDDDGRPIITDCNQTFLDTLGYQPADVIGRSLLDFYTPDSRQAFIADRSNYEAALSGKVRQVERDLLTADGRVVCTFLHAVTNVPDKNGNVTLRTMFIDITERKLAEEAHQSFEKKFLSAFKFSPVPMVITSLSDNVYLDVNESFLRLTRWRRQDLIGEAIEKGIDLWRLRDNYRAFLDEFERHDRVRNFETEYELRTGKRGFALISSELIAINDQTHVLSTIQDITQRKQLESSLRNLATRLQAISNIQHSLLSAQSVEAVAQVALRHLSRLVPTNLSIVYHYEGDSSSARVLASTASSSSPLATGQIVTSPPLDHGMREIQPIYHISDIARLPQSNEMHQTLAAEGVRSVIFVLLVVAKQPIGAWHVCAAEAGAYTDEHLNIVREVSDLLTTAVHQANMRRKLKAHTDKLEEKVAARTTELRLANAELARANRLKDEFLANMSHELRTPLSTILAKSEVLQEGIFGRLNEKQNHSLAVIEQSGRHLLGLINDILDLAKIGAGHMELNLQPTDVISICESSLAMVQELARKKEIVLEMTVFAEDLLLEVDPQRVKQILVNLLSNGVKFTPAGGKVSLEVSVDEPVEAVHFAVADTGIGIAADRIDSLFTPFLQLDGSLGRQHEGTGLGLALVSRLTKLHGGTVSVTSEVGQGSCFTVSLPLKIRVPETMPETAVDNGWYYNEEVEGKRPFRLLLVEDHLLMAESYREYLEHLNYPVFVAYSGQMALDMLAESDPDLILMDIQMPGMDGLEAIRRIRARPNQRNIPIVAVTALAMPGDRERCLEAGATEYVSKPIAIKKLRELVRKYERQHNP